MEGISGDYSGIGAEGQEFLHQQQFTERGREEEVLQATASSPAERTTFILTLCFVSPEMTLGQKDRQLFCTGCSQSSENLETPERRELQVQGMG